MIKLNELTFSKGDLSVTIRSEGIVSSGAEISRPDPVQPEQINKPPEEKPAASEKEHPRIEPERLPEFAQTINAVITGTFYASPKAGAPPFVKEGDTVEKGDVVCIVEAMKLFNEITAPIKCKILKLLVKNTEEVKKDQPLMAVLEI